jgi:hypothetical protein
MLRSLPTAKEAKGPSLCFLHYLDGYGAYHHSPVSACSRTILMKFFADEDNHLFL